LLLGLAFLLVPACGGVSVQGARPWAGNEAIADDEKAVALAAYQLGRCSDVLGQALPLTRERITLYRVGTQLQLISESHGLTPLVFDNRLHADDGHTFQAILDGQLLEIQLPTARRKGHWLLASHWEEWQQARGFGARPVRVVERCEVATLQKPADEAKEIPFGLAKPPLPGYGMRPVHDRSEQ
jgi:hypothetical protein